MLKVRLILCGKKAQPVYKIGVMDSRTKRNGFLIQSIGFYNPQTKDFKLKVNFMFNHLKCGVQPTKKVQFFLLMSKIIFTL